MIELPSLTRSDVTFLASVRVEGPIVAAHGSIEDRDPGTWLRPYLDALHEAIVAGRLAHVTLDLRGLALVNSSAIVCLLSWIKRIQGLEANRYGLRVLSDSNVQWHRITLRSIAKMAPEVLTLE